MLLPPSSYARDKSGAAMSSLRWKICLSDWQAWALRSAGRLGWTEGCNEDIFSLLANLLQQTDLNSLFSSWQNEIQAIRDQKHLPFIYLVIHKVPHHHGIWKPAMNWGEFPRAKGLQGFLIAIKISSWGFSFFSFLSSEFLSITVDHCGD